MKSFLFLSKVVFLLTGILLLITLMVFLYVRVSTAVASGNRVPAYAGLPNSLAGYPLMAVIRASLKPCGTPGMLTLVLQSPRSGGSVQQAVQAAMRELDPAGKLHYSLVGPGLTRAQVRSGYATIESLARDLGCAITGLPQQINTPTPAAKPSSTPSPIRD
jgi:hypothetical protein